MKRAVLLTLAVFLSLVAGVPAATAPSHPLLALTEGALGSGSRLVALDPRTLQPRGGSLALPGWAFGYEWARSPDGDRIAVVPKPSEKNERLFVIGTRGSLHVLARMPLTGEDVCRLAWPSARRLLLVLTRGAACYTVTASGRVLVVDPLSGRVVTERPLFGRTVVMAAARTRDGLALLLAPPAGRRGARLALVAAASTRTFPLPSVQVSTSPLDKSVVGGAIGLAVNGQDGHAYVVEPEGHVLDVSLASRKVKVHALPLRKPATAAKGAVQSIVQALWLGRGVLAITGVRRTPTGRLLPLGLRFTDTRSWRSRLVDAGATGMAYSGTTVLAFQPFFDQLRERTTAIGLRGYGLDGLMTFRAFAGKPITLVRVQGRYAYPAGLGSVGMPVVDADRGRVEPSQPGAVSILPFQLLAGTSH